MFEKICKDLKRKAKLKIQNVDLSSSGGCGYFMTWVPMHQDHHKHHSKKKKTRRVERYKTNWDYDQIPILFYQEQTIQKVAQTLRKSCDCPNKRGGGGGGKLFGTKSQFDLFFRTHLYIQRTGPVK